MLIACDFRRDNMYPEGNISLAHNYCRNPDSNWDESLWCYTTDSQLRWDHCDVPYCSEYMCDSLVLNVLWCFLLKMVGSLHYPLERGQEPLIHVEKP